MLPYLGLITIVGSWIAGAALLGGWRQAELRTLSRHAASARAAYWLFAVSLTVVGLALYEWVVAWFAPRLGLGGGFVGLLAFTIGLLLVAAWVPDRPGWQRRLHGAAAWLMATLFLPLAALIVAAPDLVFRVRFVAAASGLYMAGSFVWGVVLRRGRERFLAFQVAYIVAFQAMILATAYLP